jgi:enoyl-CoA hydratase
MVESPVLTVERDEHVVTLWLDRPEQRNALGADFWRDMPLVMEELSDDPDVRAVVIAAKGPAFTVGLDLKNTGLLAAAPDPNRSGSGAAKRSAAYKEVKRVQAAINAVADCPKPTIAVTHGWCIGGGVDLITACDIRIASADTTFSVRETKIAIVADLGTLQRLPGIVGKGHLAELVYTGKDISAARAAEIGLVNQVYPDAETALKAARELAAEIAANSPLAVQGAKAVMRAGEGRPVSDGLDYVALWNSAFLGSNDLMEAMAAFMEKRPPKFTGE